MRRTRVRSSCQASIAAQHAAHVRYVDNAGIYTHLQSKGRRRYILPQRLDDHAACTSSIPAKQFAQRRAYAASLNSAARGASDTRGNVSARCGCMERAEECDRLCTGDLTLGQRDATTARNPPWKRRQDAELRTLQHRRMRRRA